jgi:putative ABC transport system permease protein
MTVILRNVGEGVAIALDSIRSNKLRSALTILGVVIGVTTVMAVASLVQGIRRQIFNAIEVAGPTTFYVIRYFSQTPVNPDRLPYEVRIRPILQRSDAEALRRLPEIRYAGIWVQVFQKAEFQGVRTQQIIIFGADDRYMEIQGGTLLRGRFFSRAELTGEPVIVLESAVADRLFGRLDPLGALVRIGGVSFRVIGVFEKPSNIFEPPGQATGGVVPFAAARESFQYDETNALFVAVKPRTGVQVGTAMDAVTVALRRARNLRPGDPNTFDLITQDQILDVVGNLTSYFFLAMVALSSVALLVGGIGVMAIMMVSVSDRTKEIGLRKALGATRADIRRQFLVEALVLTALGGALGVLSGWVLAFGVATFTPLPARITPWSVVLALAVGTAAGTLFGVYPASRAARLDPIAALRVE